jgi:N utilization substance protein B
MVDMYFKIFKSEVAEVNPESLSAAERDNLQFARSLIEGVLTKFEEVDALITAASTNWSICRMSRVDRNILRFATYEMAFCSDIPLNVSINEAIEVAKAYGTPDSPMFINGVLDNISSTLQREESGVVKLVSRSQKIAANG